MQQWWNIKGEEPKQPIKDPDILDGLGWVSILAGLGGFIGMAIVEKYFLPNLTKFQKDCVAGIVATLIYFVWEIFWGRNGLNGNIFKRLICYCLMGFGLGFIFCNYGLRGRNNPPDPNVIPQFEWLGMFMVLFGVWLGRAVFEVFANKKYLKGEKENE